MPRRRRNNKRRQRRPQKAGQGAFDGLAGARGGAPKTFGAVAPVRRFEVNQFTDSAATDFYDGAGILLVNLVSGIGQGLTDQQRLGDRIQLLDLHIHGYIYNHVGVGTNTLTNYRIIVFQYFSDNGASAPSPANMLISSAANAGSTQGTWSHIQIDRVYQYRIVYDSRPFTTVGSASIAVLGSAGGTGIRTNFSFRVPLRRTDRNITYFAGGANGPNHLYFMVLSDQATIATNPTCFWSSRVRYIG
jgi:hypothetical protein